jgi:pimeloyl-ACP methyl ester carboxylesterase
MAWLPGAYHGAKDFIDAGFAAAVASRGLAIDLLFIDLGMQHLQDRSVIAQLRADILGPARQHSRLWFGGISLGGLLALDYVACHPTEIDGVCLLAPYLGNRMLTGEIAQAGGLAGWTAGPLAESDEERRIWRYLQSRGAGDVPLFLGYGQDDRFAPAHALMASVLPPAWVRTVKGGHDWPTWLKLWEEFLDLRLNE